MNPSSVFRFLQNTHFFPHLFLAPIRTRYAISVDFLLVQLISNFAHYTKVHREWIRQKSDDTTYLFFCLCVVILRTFSMRDWFRFQIIWTIFLHFTTRFSEQNNVYVDIRTFDSILIDDLFAVNESINILNSFDSQTITKTTEKKKLWKSPMD